jgi:hypothetical protein
VTKREAIELREGLRGPFGRWILEKLRKDGEKLRDEVIEFVPTNMGELNDREQNFGRAKALLELVNGIPTLIEEMIRELPE